MISLGSTPELGEITLSPVAADTSVLAEIHAEALEPHKYLLTLMGKPDRADIMFMYTLPQKGYGYVMGRKRNEFIEDVSDPDFWRGKTYCGIGEGMSDIAEFASRYCSEVCVIEPFPYHLGDLLLRALTDERMASSGYRIGKRALARRLEAMEFYRATEAYKLLPMTLKSAVAANPWLFGHFDIVSCVYGPDTRSIDGDSDGNNELAQMLLKDYWSFFIDATWLRE